jgi:hypothetical protein
MPIIYPCMCLTLLLDDAWKKEETLICAKIGVVMPLLIFKILYTNSGEFSPFFDELSRFSSKSEMLSVLSSITKKGEIESVSRPLIDFDD